MRALGEAECLSLWERGARLHPLDRALLAIEAGFPELAEAPADWPLGKRNRALAQLHCACFGPQLRGWTACRDCTEKLEFSLDAGAVAATETDDAPILWRGQPYRLPTSRDLSLIADEPDPDTAASRLASLCHLGDQDANWDNTELDALGEAMAQADHLAEILLHFDCPECGAHFDENLDLATFFWSELAAPARRLLQDVHVLASAYGWTESEILALPPPRRAAYIGMVRA